jgi:two-component system CheB/CheR fusion protein
MALHQMEQVADYTSLLDKNPDEIELLFKELLINVTRFFRDPQAFEALYKKGVLGLLENKDAGSSFRIWVTGCSTGEEAYSLVMLLVEEMEKRKVHLSLQIFASDLDAEAIEKARSAVYPESICADVSQERLDRFFTKEGKTFRVKKQIRECLVFAVHDMAKDPPFSRMDLISCRNVLIYMDQVLQKKVLSLFHSSLLDHGVLFLGSSESIGELSGLFSALDTKWKIYKRKGISRRRAAVVLPRPLASVQPDNPVFPDNNSVRSHKYRLQKTNEELQTAIEEFQSTNEELQSAIEELETSKEELQSTNEELVTVNAELQRTVDQLTQADADIKNLLANTEVASIFLDSHLHIKRFTPSMAKIFRVLQSDIGRSLRDITSNISAFNIYAAVETVIASRTRNEFEVESEDGLWFTLRIVPFKTIDNVVDGVVVTFLDITEHKKALDNAA